MFRYLIALALLVLGTAAAQAQGSTAKPFYPGGTYAALTASASSTDATLPAGATVMAFNTGTTAVSCQLTVGAGTSTSNKNIIQPASWLAFTVSNYTHISCINQGTDATNNLVILSGGANLPIGAGGGSSGGGGGGASSNFSAAFPSAGTAVGYTDGATPTAHMVPGQVLGSGSDSLSNSIPQVVNGGFNYVFNGTTWDRLHGDASGAGNFPGAAWTKVLNVNSNGQQPMSKSSPVVLASDQSTLSVNVANVNGNGSKSSANSSPVVIANDQIAFPINIQTGSGAAINFGQAAMGSSLPVAIANNQSAIPASATIVGPLGSQASSASVSVAIASDQTVPVSLKAVATGGASTNSAITASGTPAAVVVKAAAGTLYGAQLGTIGSNPAYLKLYNATTATCGSGTPVKRLIIPSASTGANGGGSNITFGPQGIVFGSGIVYCVTAGIADTDATGVAASSVLINLDYN